ncbi:TPA_asm: L [Asclepias syriaca virus 1]|uniref:RNA-directed RNA polymerase L n=1 Tax=Asclepias syriaca virus 1 TaxID=2793722 RepID=A0A8D9UJ32_9RHAB|nr:L [Asclepias syriaca virus 1] [Asclepias syriaca virus 1]DAF42290.1 TPA_asm: L [Asclepias syriaca virus 1]
MEVNNELGEERKQSIYDDLPDFHLRNPLRSFRDVVDPTSVKFSRDKRLKGSYDTLKKERDIYVPGISHELWTTTNLCTLDITSEILSHCLGDVIYKLCLEHPWNKIINISGMIESLHRYSEMADRGKAETMISFQHILMVINALSSRRPVMSKYEQFRSGDTVRIRAKNGNQLILTPSLLGIVRAGSGKVVEMYLSDWVRCASDVHTERFLLNFGSITGNTMNALHYPPPEKIVDLEDWGDSVLRTFGNSGFKLLKAYEALCAGFIMATEEEDTVDSTVFWKNTVRDLIEENEEYTGPITKLKEILESQMSSVHWISQMYGLHRIWGHPEVSAQKGMEKVINIGRKNIVLSDKMPTVAGRHFKFMFLSSFRRRHNRYPKLKYTGEDKEFEDKLINNDLSAVECPKDHISDDWDNVQLEQNYQLPETFNLSMIVADKSVSPTKLELIKNIKSKKSVMNQELRRGVLRWLNEKTVDPRELLQSVNDGLFPDDQKIIGLTPKERELNPVPRMFALMSHLLRVYVVVTESMLSEHILPLFPQITMTDTLLDLNKKIIDNVSVQKMNRRKVKTGQRTICMSLDFDKWNGHMRKQSTYHIFYQLGSLFGLPNLFNATYDIFQSSYIYLADGTYLPKVSKEGQLLVEEPNSFTGHMGGMEGLRQKGWTLFTVVCLDMICRKHNCTYKSMGMGDNQILMLTFFTHNVSADGNINSRGRADLQRNYKALFRELKDVFGELGLPLKPLETWASENLFLYGKYPIWKGLPMTMDLKRIMRIFPFSNIDVMTIENMLNTVSGSATAATLSAPCVAVSYITGLLMLSYTIRGILEYHPLIGESILLHSIPTNPKPKAKHQPRSWTLRTSSGIKIEYNVDVIPSLDDIVMLMMIVPRSLGGYVTYNVISSLVRGFPDPLSRDLYYVHEIWKGADRGSIKNALSAWKQIVLMPDINYRMLLEDVLSVNLLNPVTPMANVRQSVNQFLSSPGKIRNEEFLSLIKMSSEDTKNKLANVLCSGEELHIRLLHDIFSATIPGYVDSIVSKVTKTSTIQKIAMKTSKRDVTYAITLVESNFFKYFIWRGSVSGIPWQSDCPTEYAKLIRCTGWKKQLKGVTVPYPLSFMTKADCYSSGKVCDCSDGYLSVHVSDKFVSQEDWDLRIGDSLPYMGSMTKEKVTIESGARLYSSEPLVRRPVQLLRAINWFVEEKSLTAEAIEACVSAVTDLEMEQFKSVREGTSGAESHRYKDTSLSHGSLTSSNFLYSTRYHMSTDNMYRYSKGSVNYDLHYQSLLCIVSECCNQDIFNYDRRVKLLRRCSHWRQYCYSCVNPVDENFHDLGKSGSVAFIPYSKKNRYLYVESSKISYVWETRPFECMIRGAMTEERYKHMRPEAKNHWLVETFSDKIISQMTSYLDDRSEQTSKVEMHSGEIFNRVAYLKMRPDVLICSVIRKLLIISESYLLMPGDFKRPLADHIKEKALSIISETYQGNLIGLGLILSWSETKTSLFDKFDVDIDDDPPSLSGACEAMRRLLYTCISSPLLPIKRREIYAVVDEMKNDGTAYKLMTCEKMLSINGACEKCIIKLMSVPKHDYTQRILLATCDKGHVILERYSLKIETSNVTLDRLRKDCSSDTSGSKVDSYTKWKRRNKIIASVSANIAMIFRSHELRNRTVNWNESDMIRFTSTRNLEHEQYSEWVSSDILKIITKPTAALYKYVDLLSSFKKFIAPCKKALLLGDGSGHTSSLLREMFPELHLTVSTLVDSDYVISQTMPHLFDHTRGDANLDKVSMISKVNNVLHPDWGKDWLEKAATSEFLISDIEMLGADRDCDRIILLKKILNMTSWKLIILKDYIYDSASLIRKTSIISRCTTKSLLVSSLHRQRNYPEVWWILMDTIDVVESSRSTDIRSYSPDIIAEIWKRFLFVLKRSDDPLGVGTMSINDQIVNQSIFKKMLDRARMKLSIKGVGCMVPRDDNFTRILGKLQTSFRPIDVNFSRTRDTPKMYRSSEKQLTSILLTLAVSMIADVYDRVEFLKSYKHWKLKYKKRRELSTWTPYLIKMVNEQPDVEIYDDFIGVLNSYMKTKKLIFRSFKEEIKFDYKKKRSDLCFPIAKNLVLRLPR